tara:strand:+ start:214 stop:660 length:447 start_codon:yes stop_codon:yes gene_type:complete
MIHPLTCSSVTQAQKAKMMEIADTILDQLGGRRFIKMTGAKTFVSTGEGVYFKFPSAKNGINSVVINLHEDDTYSLHFDKIRGDSVKEMGSYYDVYAESLRQVFTDATGLETSLGYNPAAVEKEIKRDPRIKGREAKAIHRLLKGRRN